MKFRKPALKAYPRFILMIFSFILLCIGTVSECQGQDDTRLVRVPNGYDIPISRILSSRGIEKIYSTGLIVSKSERLLKLIVNDRHIKSYVFCLGGSPDADKTRRGDKATPVGVYYVCEKLPRSSFYLSLKLSYPNTEDARRGYHRGLIDYHTYRKIHTAVSRGGKPPMTTRLGGNICIHGGGAGELVRKDGQLYVKVRDWTAGCVALDNAQMRELFHFIQIGTPVRIVE